VLHYHSKSLRSIEQEINNIDQAIVKARKIEEQQMELKKELAQLNKQLAKIKEKVEISWLDYKDNEEVYQSMAENHNNYKEDCQEFKSKTEAIRADVEI
jgi:archaellum component FlaC